MLKNPAEKYRRLQPIALPDRMWPNKTITAPPIWMSTDLRDGNQALIEPMSTAKKLYMFQQLLAIGFKEIEVAFPSASQTDYDFVCNLIKQNLVPHDITIGVLTQSREELIKRTLKSLQGARRAIVHLYNSIAPSFQQIVFNTDYNGVKEIALRGVRLIKELTDLIPETEWVFEYSPESFSATELEFAKEVCDAVSEIWQPTPERKMIINLPATVEISTPNTFADQIEWMHRNLDRRDCIILSIHPHNDRGTAVAAAELALMAGAERVEGCLFGNGERTGNVDIITLALNLYSQGIHPELDFSDIDQVCQMVEFCNQLPVHPRHPYAGNLVFTSFSGSHQDAIKKGFSKKQLDGFWEVPYLPIDPADLNRSYEAVIRVNSQSGKGGVSYILYQEYGFDLPRRLQIEFSRIVQQFTEIKGAEAKSEDIYNLFKVEYLEQCEPYSYICHKLEEQIDGNPSSKVKINVTLEKNGNCQIVSGQGNGPIDAFVNGLGFDISIFDYHEHSIGSGANAEAICYVEFQIRQGQPLFGVGTDKNIVAAALKALLNGINRESALQNQTNGIAE
ncbi:2-isopropylmalate synthase [Nostoc commune]|uniref:2-isopropylmalate synthase n=1 Tax=Nostoc commune TaxID=1178 RepID=UPI0018C79459|nr:2-isopropylmalate synthase [Nostoc commune]MBG1262377.1 2-isopropylmalate synthase [Nostoc commune BAE]